MLVKENYFIYFATKLACQQICPVKLSPTELLHTHKQKVECHVTRTSASVAEHENRDGTIYQRIR